MNILPPKIQRSVENHHGFQWLVFKWLVFNCHVTSPGCKVVSFARMVLTVKIS